MLKLPCNNCSVSISLNAEAASFEPKEIGTVTSLVCSSSIYFSTWISLKVSSRLLVYFLVVSNLKNYIVLF